MRKAGGKVPVFGMEEQKKNPIERWFFMRSLDEISKTNPEKPLLLKVDGKEYYRCPIHTHFIKPGENLSDLMRQYVQPYIEENDVVYISEKIVSLCQKDIIPKETLKISKLAKFLSKFASTNDSAGIGVHNVYKMQVAIMLCGAPKVMYAALAAGVGRIFGKRGVFYEITGPQVAGLDGFYSTYFPDYKNFGILSPKNPDKAVAKVEEETGIHCCVADINDFGGEVLAISPKAPFDNPLLQKLLKDNPAGNGKEMTPFVLMREKKDDQ